MGDRNKKSIKRKNDTFTSGKTNLNAYLQNKEDSNTEGNFAKYSEELVSTNIYDDPKLMEIRKKVINEVDAEVISKLETTREMKEGIKELVDNICNTEYPTLPNREREILTKALIDEFTGFGPLQRLILDNSVSEIMINGPEQIYVEKNGKIVLTDVKFANDEHVIKVIDKIVSPIGRRIDEGSPMVDARLPDGSRVNAIIPPISLKGPTLTIRKFEAIPFTMDKLVEFETLSKEMAEFLDKSVRAKSNIIVAGGTGSGKTTFLNVLSGFIPHSQRIITIEDSAELQLQQPHVISLESRPANIEGKGEITIRDLVKNSLRMRPDRIVVGEVRGGECLDMLQAMNTGHNGSLSTIHANSSRDAVSRLETMVLYSGIEFPMKAIRDQIYSAIDLIVYTERLLDGSRKVTKITEVVGIEGDVISLHDIFYFQQNSTRNGKVRGEFVKSSVRPKIIEKFNYMGISIERW